MLPASGARRQAAPPSAAAPGAALDAHGCPAHGCLEPAPTALPLATPQSLLRFVCDMAQRQADPRLAGRVALPFYAVLVCELLAKLKGVDEPLLT